MLKEARLGRKWTRRDLIEEFTRTARRLGYRDLTVTERQIQRWESSNPPTPHPPQARVLEAVFGLSLAELGWSSYKGTDLGAIGEWTPVSTIDSYFLPASEDMKRRQFILTGPALSAFAFKYLSSRDWPVERLLPQGPSVGESEVEALRDAVNRIRNVDSVVGSEPVVDIVKEQCSKVFAVLRSASYSNSIGKQLFSIASDITGIAGWLLFDAGKDAEAQHYLRLSLRAARHANDDHLASIALGYMSIQKYNLCEWDDAATLARAARKLIDRYDSPLVVASLLTREARALAGQGDLHGCYALLDQSYLCESKGRGSDHPHQVDWVDRGELHGQASGCAALLGDLDTASIELDLARQQYGSSAPRSNSLHMLRVALAYAQAGDVETACSLATDALRIGSDVRSYRFDEVKGDLLNALQPNVGSRYVQALVGEHKLLLHPRLPRSALSLR